MDLGEGLFQDLAVDGAQFTVVEAIRFEVPGDLRVTGVPGVEVGPDAWIERLEVVVLE